MAAVHFAHPPSLGFGDVRLSVLNGLLCGWWGLQVALAGLAAGFVLALPEALVALARHGLRERRPPGPYRLLGSRDQRPRSGLAGPSVSTELIALRPQEAPISVPMSWTPPQQGHGRPATGAACIHQQAGRDMPPGRCGIGVRVLAAAVRP
jgi:hypothetical protein